MRTESPSKIQYTPKMSATGRPTNNLLQKMNAHDFKLVETSLIYEHRVSGDLLYQPGDSVEFIYFPCDASLASFLVANEDGFDVETVLVGREGAVGGVVSAGRLPAYCRITVKHSGPFAKVPTEILQQAKSASATVRNLFSRYADCLLAQIFQSSACNAVHSVEQRTAKWITAAMERTGDHVVPLTHDELASMLGVGRSYISRVIQTFKAEGILSTGRGILRIQSFDQLNARACKCNEMVKSHFEAVLSGVYP
ncbi:MAG TPA: Crp/Fnr family transcriptional regulator [Steroidobacteraceae bacterium]|jgi:hypothetical protein|nr:Crp/Fnr family transcriptional regulator [Steroidobacteraceae bacterium]